MKTNFAIYLAALTVVKSGTTNVESLKNDIKGQQVKVEKANKDFADEIDATQRIAKQVLAKNEADTLAEMMTALSILENEEVQADRLVDANKAKIRSFGFVTHDTVKTGSIADCVASNKKSWFSRVF